MSFSEYKRVQCAALDIAVKDVRVERMPHPTKQAHWLHRVSHPYFGAAEAPVEEDAWNRFFKIARDKPPLPDFCQAKTKAGQPCKSKPQRGEIYCGPHLTVHGPKRIG